MKTKTTADIRKAEELTGSFILNKMKQGRDQVIKQRFIVIEVPADTDDKLALDYAKTYLDREIENG